VTVRSKRPATVVEDSDEDDVAVTKKKSTKPKQKKKKNDAAEVEAVDCVVKKLKELHHESGNTPMQLRIWAEMHHGGLHPSLNEPPTTSMFTRAGGGHTAKKKTPPNTNDPLSQAIAQLAKALVPCTCSTPSSSQAGRGSTGTSASPAKLIDNRTKCYKQLSELSNLKQSGLLNDEEYDGEREVIMNLLRKLSA
jgi:hypothetical protein